MARNGPGGAAPSAPAIRARTTGSRRACGEPGSS
jgi:hypothetical protein